jgi:hypothetical protein
MDSVSAQRTLVKSPPELWAKLSNAAELTRHLEDDFGEIRITRLEAERTVVWEGDSGRGTVELEASGWGTKVTLTAEPVGEPPEQPLTAEPVGEPPEQPKAPPAANAGPAPTLESNAIERAPEPGGRAGFFSRILGRMTPGRGQRAPGPGASASGPAGEEPRRPNLSAAPDPAPTKRPEPVPDAVLSPSAAPGKPSGERASRVLETVLDDLGAAHHRPFSRG